MADGIFLLQGDELVELSESQYDSEAVLQRLLAEYPNLLPGQQINPTMPRRWLLVRREVSLADDPSGMGRWSVDHLFLDQEGIPTLVEVKRSSDTRIRREVVGQMLDYGANAVLHWPVESLRSHYENRCAKENLSANELMSELLGEDGEPESFWELVRTNLQAGRIRMIFVSDVIPPELRRIVEFLNGQMQPAEVLAVEVRQFAGEGLKTFVPRVMGMTAGAQQKKNSGGAPVQWDESMFMSEVHRRGGAEDAATAARILAWANSCGVRIWWGRGKGHGSFLAQPDVGGEKRWLLSVWTDATFAIVFEQMKTRPPFDQRDMRLELRARLREVLGPSMLVDERDADRRLHYPLAMLRPDDQLTAFLAVLDWAVREIRDCRSPAANVSV